MKANHNLSDALFWTGWDVSDTSKILKWKQITTETGNVYTAKAMFPILQRY